MKKYDCVVALGCSFVEGDQIRDVGGKNIGFQYRMSKLLSDKLKCDEISLSRCGGSNERIFRKLYEWVESNTKYKKPLVIIGLTDISRTQLYSNLSNEYTDVHINTMFKNNEIGIDNTLLKPWVDVYMKYFYNEDEEDTKLQRNVLFTDSYLKQRDIDYLIFNSLGDNISNISNQINYLSFGYQDTIDSWQHYLHSKHDAEFGKMDSNITCRTKPPYGKYLCGGHPSPEANIHLTESIYKKIQKL
jgi:hypothetical protein